MVEGMTGIEVIADDFLIFGCGNTQQEAIWEHDKVLRRFVVKCEQKNLHLNSAKVKLRESTVYYIGFISRWITARRRQTECHSNDAVSERSNRNFSEWFSTLISLSMVKVQIM